MRSVGGIRPARPAAVVTCWAGLELWELGRADEAVNGGYHTFRDDVSSSPKAANAT